MNYYRRDNGDGTCEVICARCFLTLGTVGPGAARELEALHLCHAVSPHGLTSDPRLNPDRADKKNSASASFAARPFSFDTPAHATFIPFAYVSIIFFAYALPTAVEFVATQHFNGWVACILPGDVVGCFCLAAIFKLRRTAVLLYLTLSVLEGLLFQLHLVSAHALVWIVDLVPTMVLLRLAARARTGDGGPHTRFVR
jgi:hypothetical protein